GDVRAAVVDGVHEVAVGDQAQRVAVGVNDLRAAVAQLGKRGHSDERVCGDGGYALLLVLQRTVERSVELELWFKSSGKRDANDRGGLGPHWTGTLGAALLRAAWADPGRADGWQPAPLPAIDAAAARVHPGGDVGGDPAGPAARGAGDAAGRTRADAGGVGAAVAHLARGPRGADRAAGRAARPADDVYRVRVLIAG